MVLPGDLIKAKIKSLSESRKIYLTIASLELGVLVSRGENGEILSPIDEETMENKESK